MRALLKIVFILGAGALAGAFLTAEGSPMTVEAIATALGAVTFAAFWAARGAEA